MKKLFPVLMLLLGTGAGVGAGVYLRPEPEPALDAGAADEAQEASVFFRDTGKPFEPTGSLDEEVPAPVADAAQQEQEDRCDET